MNINITVSNNCDHKLERKDLNQKRLVPNFFRKKKKDTTSWYSAIINAARDAMAIRTETPNTVLYPWRAHSPSADHGTVKDIN